MYDEAHSADHQHHHHGKWVAKQFELEDEITRGKPGEHFLLKIPLMNILDLQKLKEKSDADCE